MASDWEPLFAHRVAPLAFYFAQAVVGLHLPDGKEVSTILKMTKLENPLGRQDPVAQTIALQLNEGMQTILRGIPGTSDQVPT